MIPYIEVRDKESKLQKALITPIDCFFELSYYEVGEFEVVCKLSNNILATLKNGDFLTIPNKPYLFIINSLKPTFSSENGYILTLRGKEAKSILGQRVISNAKLLSTNLVTAVNELVQDNAGSTAGSARNMGIDIVESLVSETIGQTQAVIGDLYTFISELLKTKECACKIYVENNALKYQIYKGEDRSSYVIFSQTFDNLSNSEYVVDNTNEKTFVLIEGEKVLQEYNSNSALTGLDRKEVYFESGVSTKYTNTQGIEIELDLTNPTDLATYKLFLTENGKEQLTNHKIEYTFDGVIDTSTNQYKFGVDYNLGDKVKVRDDYLGVFITPRITKFTISQNPSVYGEIAEYGN